MSKHFAKLLKGKGARELYKRVCGVLKVSITHRWFANEIYSEKFIADVTVPWYHTYVMFLMLMNMVIHDVTKRFAEIIFKTISYIFFRQTIE